MRPQSRRARRGREVARGEVDVIDRRQRGGGEGPDCGMPAREVGEAPVASIFKSVSMWKVAPHAEYTPLSAITASSGFSDASGSPRRTAESSLMAHAWRASRPAPRPARRRGATA
eukprot:6731166-Prymnesium_polylepis.3